MDRRRSVLAVLGGVLVLAAVGVLAVLSQSGGHGYVTADPVSEAPEDVPVLRLTNDSLGDRETVRTAVERAVRTGETATVGLDRAAVPRAVRLYAADDGYVYVRHSGQVVALRWAIP